MSVYRPKINLLNLERLPTKVEDLIEGTPYPERIIALNKRANANAERIEFLMLDIVTHPEHKEIEYKDIMHWRERARYLRRVGQAKEANELERAEAKALQDAKDADGDEDFMTGFNDFLANEFDLD